jgi:tRNA-binding protein
MTKTIDWSDFEKLDLRAGTIIEVIPFPESRKPAWKIKVDFGELGIKQTSAQITTLYKSEDLLGKQIIGIVNFPAKQIGKFMSEFLLTGFPDENGDIVISTTERKVPNGAKLA